MKIALISYHKNISQIYPERWIETYRQSIELQTYKRFDIYEVNYGTTTERIFKNSIFEQKEFPNFVHVQNYLLDKLFADGYDCVFNSNVDDHYSVRWIEKLFGFIEHGFDIVSSNFVIFDEKELTKKHFFEKLNVEQELLNNHNVICHPSVCYSSAFWKKGNRYDPDEIPIEDLNLWKRGLSNSKYFIHPDHLCYHRIHSNSVCQSDNR